MRSSASFLAVLALSLSVPLAAHAHLGLLDPPSRYGPDVLKTGPCGMRGGARTDTPLVLPAGSPLTITWDEYINHPGHYRIAFDPDGDDDFRDPACIMNCGAGDPMPPMFETGTDPTVLMDMIPDMRGGEYSVTITLPNIACDNCTLQVIQVMYDKRPYTAGGGDDNYYQCIDLVLTMDGPTPPPVPPPPPIDDGGVVLPGDASTPPPTPPTPPPSGSPDAAMPGPDAATPRADSGSTGGGGEDDGCGCHAGTRAPKPLFSSLAALLVLGVAARIRSRSRRRRDAH